MPIETRMSITICFNTASGRYYCNEKGWTVSVSYFETNLVSIPQAVGTIAIITRPIAPIEKAALAAKFQYRKR